MKQGIIKKKDLGNLISCVKKVYRVYGPVKGAIGVSLSELISGEEIELQYSNLKMPAKSLFFPQCEVLYTYEGDALYDVSPPEDKVVVFGTRPCDARALLLLDKVFGNGDFRDPYYLQRRENAVVISTACNDPLETCFCTSFGGGPSHTEGSDVLVFDVEDCLLFEACSEKGRAFMRRYSTHFQKAREADVKTRDKQTSLAEKKVAPVDGSRIKEKLDQCFDSPVWDSLAQTCLACAACTYLCPTCHCFALFDERAGSAGAQTRNWDSCMFSAFALEASGHNPRTSYGERMRQRIMHKFCYSVDNFGEAFCVGCGRCVSNCPVNIDMRETITEVAK